MKSIFRDHWLRPVAAALALGALAPSLPFAYYQLMNWIVVVAALTTAYRAYQQQKVWAVWLFIFAAIIFNPLAPFYLRTDVWQTADILVAFLLIGSFLFL